MNKTMDKFYELLETLECRKEFDEAFEREQNDEYFSSTTLEEHLREKGIDLNSHLLVFGSAFLWGRSPQGLDYWYKKFKELKELLKK